MNDSKDSNKLIEAYDKMLHQAKEAWHKAKTKGEDVFENVFSHLKEDAHELGELTKEEADLVADYLKRDVHDAAHFMSETGHGIADWLRLDIMLIEKRLLDNLSLFVDETREQLSEIKYRADKLGRWHTGEVTGVGTLECTHCGQLLHMTKTGHIPPCPKCKQTVFHRPR